jgi:Cu/Ag efflux pump CusA
LSTIPSSIDGDKDVYTTLNEGAQSYTISVNRLEAGRLGLSVDETSNALRTQIEGRTSGTVLEEGRTPILIRGSEETRRAPPSLPNLPLTLASGRHVALSQVRSLALSAFVAKPFWLLGEARYRHSRTRPQHRSAQPQRSRSYARGDALRFINRSPFRIEPHWGLPN